jgi:hypothetical protein
MKEIDEQPKGHGSWSRNERPIAQRHAHHGRLRGPSEGIRAWTDYWIGIADWAIDARRRWRDINPPQAARRSLIHAGTVSLVVVLGARIFAC